MIVGVSGAKRNAGTALSSRGRLIAACEQERVTRIKGIGVRDGGFPWESLNIALATSGKKLEEIEKYVAAEFEISLDGLRAGTRLDHHLGHAATAFLTSPFAEALVIVCDTHEVEELSVWKGQDESLVRVEWPWHGPAFAGVYSRLTETLGFSSGRDEHRVEALARQGGNDSLAEARTLISYQGDSLSLGDNPSFVGGGVASRHSFASVREKAKVASAVQQRLGELIQDLLRDLKKMTPVDSLCLGGGLFYNTYFNSMARESGLFKRVHVAPSPGNAGLAAGIALYEDLRAKDQPSQTPFSPFLGPQYSDEEIKETLDNCKLRYTCCTDSEVLSQAAETLAAGGMVGWFQGRMEWGARALGNRSIFANPFSPYVQENVNVFLKQREPYRGFAVSVCEESMEEYFKSPSPSAFMEFEYEVKDRDLFRLVLSEGSSRLRAQTVSPGSGMAHALLRAFADRAGHAVLLNTSFNGFHEPIVCSPRDAVRVFYGSGIDLLVLGHFVIRK